MGSLVLMAWQETFEAILVALLSLSEMVYAADIPTYVMVAQAGRLTPNTLEVPADQQFKVLIRNKGIDDIEFGSLQLRKRKVVLAGGESSIVIASLIPGEYDFFDRFHMDSGRGHIIAR